MIVERELITQFGLKDAFVVPSPINEQDINESVAQAAAMYIHERLDKSGYINMGYGDTSSRILNHLANICEFPVNVVSLTGGVNYYLPNTRSSIFNAKLYLTPAPLLMASEDIVKAMEQEPSVKQIRHMATLAQMSIVGIGGVDSNATLLTNGTLNHSDVLLLSMQGAVGDMLCHFIDKDGNKQKLPNHGFKLPEGAHFAVFDDELYPNHDGIDFYHHYKEDIALLAGMGFKVYRMSIA